MVVDFPEEVSPTTTSVLLQRFSPSYAEMRAMTRHNLLTLVLQNVQELVTVLHFPPILVSRLQVNQGGL